MTRRSASRSTDCRAAIPVPMPTGQRRAGRTAIQAATDANEAAIQAGRITAIAQIQASTTATTAQIDQSQGIILANHTLAQAIFHLH